MEQSCPWEEYHPPLQLSPISSQHMWEKLNVYLLNEPKRLALSRIFCLSCLDCVDSVGRANVFLWRKFGPARRVTLPSKGEPARGVTRLQSSQIFVPHVKGSSSFVRKYKKVWFSQSRSGWRLTLQQLPAGIRFLHINGVSENIQGGGGEFRANQLETLQRGVYQMTPS